MLVTWALDAVGVFLTTVGALLIFLYLWRSRRFVDEWLTPEGKRAYAKHSDLLIVAAGLLAAWTVLQFLAVIFL